MELGCSTILYGGQPLATTLAHIQRAGYTAIELCAIPGMAEHISETTSVDDLRTLRWQIHDMGLEIESVGASTDVLDSVKRARFVRLIEAAGVLGANAITTGSGGVSDDEASFSTVVETWRELAKAARSAGVKLSVKPHVRAAVYSTETAVRFMGQVDTRAIGLNFDASHLWRANEWPEQSLAQLESYVATARIRDAVSREPGSPGTVAQQVPGDGAMNLPAIAAGLAAVPHLEHVVLEIIGTRGLPLIEIDRVVRTSHERLQELFSGG